MWNQYEINVMWNLLNASRNYLVVRLLYGRITFISPVAEKNTRTFEFIIEADNNDLLFKSGLTATITIGVDSVKAHKISPEIPPPVLKGKIGIIIDDFGYRNDEVSDGFLERVQV